MPITTLWLTSSWQWNNIFVLDLSLLLNFLFKTHYILSREPSPIVFTLFHQIASLTGLCFTFSQVFFYYTLHLRHYQFSALYWCINPLVNTSRSSMMRSLEPMSNARVSLMSRGYGSNLRHTFLRNCMFPWGLLYKSRLFHVCLKVRPSHS